MHISHGRFVWHDLIAVDPEGAKSFYTQIAQWGTQRWDESHYEMWTRDSVPLGGVESLSDRMKSNGVKPHWLPYVCVYDVDETVRLSSTLGARVIVPPKEIASIGCWAVIADPQGAVIGVYEPADETPKRNGEPKVGEFSWHELATGDYKAAADFYRAIFKWETISDYDMGEMGIYHMFGQRGQTYGGMFNRSPDMPPSSWLSYIRVPDVKPVAERVTQLGGTVFSGPMEVPGGDWVAQLSDPQGALVALHAKK